MLYFFIISIASAISVQGDKSIEYNEYDPIALERMQITNTSGKTTIRPISGRNKVIITITKRNFSENCSATISRSDIPTAVIEVKRPEGDKCEADIVIEAPQKVDLELSAGSGEVTIQGIEGNLKFEVGSGKFTATGKFAKVNGTSGSGDVDIQGVNGPGKVDIGKGTMNLKFLEDVKGNFDVRSGSGDTTLSFPKGSKINAALESASGSTQNDFSEVSRPEINVSAQAGAGTVEVKSY